MSTLILSLACNDDQGIAGEGADGSGTATDETNGMEGTEAEGQEQEGGDGDGDPGDGDGDPGDGDGDPGDGDGDPGDGDGDPGDGDGEPGDGDGDPGDGDGDGDSGDGDGDPGDGDGDPGDGDGDPGDGDGDPGDGDGDPGDGDGDDQPELLPCGNKLYECGDTLDNDMDGLIDLDDPECISPCDDNEDTFKTDLPGQNNDCKQDCYFDDNSGSGDDTCEWNLQCDPENPGEQIGCEYDPNFAMCDLDMPDTCLDVCVPLVPNGCDCFGCCEIGDQFVYLDGAQCSLDNLDACESCTFFDSCNNACDPDNCEVCFGQDPDDLPPECMEPECPDDLTPCFDESDCLEGQFCQTGCCVAIVPQ